MVGQVAGASAGNLQRVASLKMRQVSSSLSSLIFPHEDAGVRYLFHQHLKVIIRSKHDKIPRVKTFFCTETSKFKGKCINIQNGR